jgi:hypothetical protein
VETINLQKALCRPFVVSLIAWCFFVVALANHQKWLFASGGVK